MGSRSCIWEQRTEGESARTLARLHRSVCRPPPRVPPDRTLRLIAEENKRSGENPGSLPSGKSPFDEDIRSSPAP